MGFDIDQFAAALGGIQAEAEQRNQVTQQLLMNLVAQNPALAETPEIMEALSGAFPEGQYGDIAGVVGAGRRAQLGEESRMRAAAQDDMLMQLALKLAPEGLGVDLEAEPSDVVSSLFEQATTAAETERENEQTKATREFIQQLVRDRYKHADDVEIAGIRGRAQREGLEAIGQGVKGISDMVRSITPLFDMPQPTTTAGPAGDEYVNLLISQHDNDLKGLAMLSALSQATGVSISQLAAEQANNPKGFNSQYGDKWTEAQSRIARESVGGERSWETRYITGNPEAKAIAETMSAETQAAIRSHSQETRMPEFNRGKADVLEQVYGLPTQPGGDVGVPMPNGDQALVHPDLVYGAISPEVDQLMTQAQGNPVLLDAYSMALTLGAQRGMDPAEIAEQMYIIRDQLELMRVIPEFAME